MAHLYDRIADNLVFCGIVAVIFVFSMVAFFVRVRGEDRERKSGRK